MKRVFDYIGLAAGAVMAFAVLVLGYLLKAKARKVHELEGELMRKDFEGEDQKTDAKIESAKKDTQSAVASYERDRDAYLRSRGLKPCSRG